MTFRYVHLDGGTLFFREAGRVTAPKLVLLHGFPSSSHQFRSLIPALAKHFHVVAPDYPGFGYSSDPAFEPATQTFDGIAGTLERLLQTLGFTSFGLYVHGYGAAVGFRLFERRPRGLEWLVVQNANVLDDGLSAWWQRCRHRFWAERSDAMEREFEALVTDRHLRTLHLIGHPDHSKIDPDAWTIDAFQLAQPRRRDALLQLLRDDRANARLYARWQVLLRRQRPETLVVWGCGDPLFTQANVAAYRALLPGAQIMPLASGHFALEDNAAAVAERMIATFREG